jgi:Family of unknown function (DUF6492)
MEQFSPRDRARLPAAAALAQAFTFCAAQESQGLVVVSDQAGPRLPIQQVLKIAAALQLPEQRYCLIDSDNVFVRRFNVSIYAGGEKTPLYVEPAAISADAPLHGPWTRNCDRLLGAGTPAAFPADDYVGNGIVWDQQAVRDMTSAIERVSGKSWAHALCSTRDFSEYLFVRPFRAQLAAASGGPCVDDQELGQCLLG